MAKIFFILSIGSIFISSIQAGGPAGNDCRLVGILLQMTDASKTSILAILDGSTDAETVKTVIYDTALSDLNDSMVLGRLTMGILRLGTLTEDEWYKACTANILAALNTKSPPEKNNVQSVNVNEFDEI